MASHYDQYLGWDGSEAGRRFATRRRPDGHAARELLFIPALAQAELKPGDLLEIHRSLFGWILSVNIWDHATFPRGESATASKLRVGVFEWGLFLPLLLLAYQRQWIALTIGFVVWLALTLHDSAMRDNAAASRGTFAASFPDVRSASARWRRWPVPP